MRRPVAVMLMTGGLTVGASLPAETAPGAAGLRVGDRLTWTQPDGTPLAFRPELRVWCGPWASDVPVPSIHVRVGSRTRAGLSHWELHAVLADVRRRPLVRPAAAGRLPDRRASRQRALRRRAGQRPRLLLRVDVGAVMRSRVCTHDEYLIAAEHKSQVKWNGDTGSIQITDLPSASAYFEEMHFETAIVGVDVDGKGTDKILKVFTWGSTKQGTVQQHDKGDKIADKDSHIVTSATPSATFKQILKNDYPDYKYT